jgi:hypothetical protein
MAERRLKVSFSNLKIKKKDRGYAYAARLTKEQSSLKNAAGG